MKNRKMLLNLLVLVLVAAISITGTLAFLTDKTGEVKNTFTVGEVKIDLKEKKVAENGSVPEGTAAANYTETEQSYKIFPGGTYNKAPAVLVDADSEECYVFVKLTNGMETFEATGEGTIAAQMVANGWTLKDETNGIWQYDEIAEPSAVLPLFDTITIRGDWDGTGTLSDIVIIAAAVQADNCTAAQALTEATALLTGN